jgi:hypothetical protein
MCNYTLSVFIHPPPEKKKKKKKKKESEIPPKIHMKASRRYSARVP